MSSAPFSAALVMARLREQVTDLRSVEGIAAYSAVRNLSEFQPDGAHVLLVRERHNGEPPKAGRQAAIVTFGVIIAVRNFRDPSGAESIDDISPLIGQVRAALMGWIPPVAGGRPCKWSEGDVLQYDQQTLLWADVYETQHFIGGTP